MVQNKSQNSLTYPASPRSDVVDSNSHFNNRLVQFPDRDRITTKVDDLFEPLSRPNSENWTNLRP